MQDTLFSKSEVPVECEIVPTKKKPPRKPEMIQQRMAEREMIVTSELGRPVRVLVEVGGYKHERLLRSGDGEYAGSISYWTLRSSALEMGGILYLCSSFHLLNGDKLGIDALLAIAEDMRPSIDDGSIVFAEGTDEHRLLRELEMWLRQLNSARYQISTMMRELKWPEKSDRFTYEKGREVRVLATFARRGWGQEAANTGLELYKLNNLHIKEISETVTAITGQIWGDPADE